MRSLAVLLALAACNGARPPEKSPGAGSAPTTTPPVASTDCDALDRHECLESTACTLELAAPNAYRCRPEAGPCETGLVQSDEKACTARAACKFVPATCYCHCRGYGKTKVEDTHGPACKCDCGGDAPPACVPK